MSGIYMGDSLEEHLNRINALLIVVEHAFDDRDDEELMDGADICLEQVIDLVKKLQAHLPPEAINAVVQTSRKGAAR